MLIADLVIMVGIYTGKSYTICVFVGLSMILYTKVRKKFNGRKPAKGTHWTVIRPSEMVF